MTFAKNISLHDPNSQQQIKKHLLAFSKNGGDALKRGIGIPVPFWGEDSNQANLDINFSR